LRGLREKQKRLDFKSNKKRRIDWLKCKRIKMMRLRESAWRRRNKKIGSVKLI
jgi:hypothetical protein